jgi:hypothetical protein
MTSKNDFTKSTHIRKHFLILIVLGLLFYACQSTPTNEQIVFTDTIDLAEYGKEVIADARKAFDERSTKGDTIRLGHQKLFEYLPKSLKNCMNDGSPIIQKNQFYTKVGQHFRYKNHRFMVSVADFNNEFALFDDDIMIVTKSKAFEGATEIRKAVKVGNHKGLFLYQESKIGTWGLCNFWVNNRFIIYVEVELPGNKETLEEILSLIDFSQMPRLK